ncbi:MAG: hypothetical protein HY980_00810 [Candidatus Magasanikbacteria bacterium]|nr:hypothetical protein [Candidatus Magasanikbacteria bacterium]
MVRGPRTWEAIDEFCEEDLFAFTTRVMEVGITDSYGRQWSWRVRASRGGYFTRLDGQRTTSAFLAFAAVARSERSGAQIWPHPHTVALVLKGGGVVVIGQRRAGLVSPR